MSMSELDGLERAAKLILLQSKEIAGILDDIQRLRSEVESLQVQVKTLQERVGLKSVELGPENGKIPGRGL